MIEVVTKYIALILSSLDLKISNRALVYFSSIIVNLLNDFLLSLKRMMQQQRRVHPGYLDLVFVLKSFSIDPNELFYQIQLTKAIRNGPLGGSLKLLKKQSEDFIAELNERHEEDELNKNDKDFKDICALMPSTNKRKFYIQNYIPEFPPDHTYRYSSVFTRKVEDPKHLRQILADEGNSALKSLLNLQSHKDKDVEIEQEKEDSFIDSTIADKVQEQSLISPPLSPIQDEKAEKVIEENVLKDNIVPSATDETQQEDKISEIREVVESVPEKKLMEIKDDAKSKPEELTTDTNGSTESEPGEKPKDAKSAIQIEPVKKRSEIKTEIEAATKDNAAEIKEEPGSDPLVKIDEIKDNSAKGLTKKSVVSEQQKASGEATKNEGPEDFSKLININLPTKPLDIAKYANDRLSMLDKRREKMLLQINSLRRDSAYVNYLTIEKHISSYKSTKIDTTQIDKLDIQTYKLQRQKVAHNEQLMEFSLTKSVGNAINNTLNNEYNLLLRNLRQQKKRKNVRLQRRLEIKKRKQEELQKQKEKEEQERRAAEAAEAHEDDDDELNDLNDLEELNDLEFENFEFGFDDENFDIEPKEAER